MCDKEIYHSAHEARQMAHGLAKNGKGHFNSYQCPVCAKWHVSSARKKKLKKLPKRIQLKMKQFVRKLDQELRDIKNRYNQ